MTSTTNPDFADDVRAKLRQQFLDQPEDKLTGRWEDLWQQSITPWDRDGPSIALKDAIIGKPELFGTPIHNSKRKRALVPGCGRGYDVFLLASLGYDTYGLDAAQTALDAAKRVQKEVPADERYSVHNAEVGRGETKLILNDFFKDDFLADTKGGNFDLIFDYTFLCALPPDLRPKWSKRMSELLSPRGVLVCLEWPLGKDPQQGGPPFGVTEALFQQLLVRPGENVKYDTAGIVIPDQLEEYSGAGLSRVDRYLPQRTHEATKGNDHVSLWQHAKTSEQRSTL